MTVKTLKNSLAILECFASTENALGVREISRMTNMHTSVVQRTINTFTEAGYLIQDESTKKNIKWATKCLYFMTSFRIQVTRIRPFMN